MIRRLALCLVVLLADAIAQDMPGTLPEAVEAVLAAVKAKDTARLRTIAEKAPSDAWMIAEELCMRGAHDAAAAFAQAAPGNACAKLPEYVAARRGKETDAEAVKVLAAIAALDDSEWQQAVRLAESIEGPLDTVVRILIAIRHGAALTVARRFEESVAVASAAGSASHELGWLKGAMHAFDIAAKAAFRDSNLRAAARVLEALARVARDSGNPRVQATVVGNLALVQMNLGQYAKALAGHRQCLEMRRALGDEWGVAGALRNVASVRIMLGRHAEALVELDRARAILEGMEDLEELASVLAVIGTAHHRLDNFDEAIAAHERALAIYETLGQKQRIALLLSNVAGTRGNQGHYDEALPILRRALAMYEAIGYTAGRTHVLRGIGFCQFKLKRYEDARNTWARARVLLAERPNVHDEMLVAGDLAEMHLTEGEPAQATAEARRAVEHAMSLAERLAEGEGAGFRDQYSGVFDAGYRAALRAERMEDLVWLLEQGRAGSLREALGSRRALEEAVIPTALRKALEEARLLERKALAAYHEAQASRQRKSIKAARTAWRDAQAQVGRVSARLQREAKAAANVALPDPDDLPEIQAHLRPHEALVLFALTSEEAFALVVRRESARTVVLGATTAVNAAALDLLDDPRFVDPAQAPALRKALIGPLALPADVTRVLVSPMGLLGYVPFALLFPEREVAYVPSGTTYGLLREQAAARGRSVLALGDPDYTSDGDETSARLHRRLPALPATRAEVKAVGDVPLLGKDATEAGLAHALAGRPRWRAIHFACHGLVYPERPMLSALALTADARDDGFLTVLEIFRLKAPADLVVMSACDTGRGKIYLTEGIVGLTRAFMFAGAPRVLCSLWKVDDEATRALMVEFYKRWNGTERVGAAAALKQAQEAVRAHDKWRHPHYWAAWVLWGLPD